MKALQGRKYQPSETNFLMGKDTDDYLIDPQRSAIIKRYLLPYLAYHNLSINQKALTFSSLS